MIIDLYYSTIGLILDIMIITIPILFHFGASKRTRIKSYAIVYLMTYLVLGLPFEYIAQYLIIFFGILLIFELPYIFMSSIVFAIYSTLYKLVLLKFISNIYIKLDLELKEKILSGAAVSGIIILATIIGGIYVNR